LRYAKQWPDRLWAVEGCSGIGHHVASRLVTAGETVVDVPPKLSARLRMFDTRQGRKTDPDDAQAIALVAVRMNGLRPVVNDEQHHRRPDLLRPEKGRRQDLHGSHAQPQTTPPRHRVPHHAQRHPRSEPGRATGQRL
jgi:transposase